LGKISNFNRPGPPKDRKSAPPISPARLAAFDILLRIEREKAFSAILLPFYEERLELKDRALCHELTLGVLRRQIYLDRLIDRYSVQKLDPEVRIALRLGLYQLLFLDKIPPYSAINESVNLVARARKRSAKGFVNAILRRASREPQNLTISDPIEKIAVETSHPQFLIEKWISQFGLDQAEDLAVANNEPPRSDFRRTAKTTDRTFKQLEDEPAEGAAAQTDRQISKSPIPDPQALRDLADQGEIYFQDAASQLVGQAVELQPGELFLDVCAAPGSKLTQVAAAVEQKVIGGDLHYPRVAQIAKSARQQGVSNISLVQHDAEQGLPFADETFDVILLDAPCSGTGTIRHNPEIRYHLRENDFAELSAKQLKILENASKALKRGGRLIYSTCSLEPEENETVIENFLGLHPTFTRAEIHALTKFRTPDGFARTFPHRDGMDGFFIARLLKQ
jgi:16S rRNA (cytosine967-C5)-methyltransferase